MTNPTISGPSPLRADHDLEPFDCGNPDLNDWLKRRALKDEAVGASRTFVVCLEHVVVGYYGLAAGAVNRLSSPRSMQRNMPDPIPVVVMGRLAVDVNVSGSGVGAGLVKDAVDRTLLISEAVGVKALLVHAISEDVKRWYIKLGFLESPIDSLTLCPALDSARRATMPAKQVHRILHTALDSIQSRFIRPDSIQEPSSVKRRAMTTQDDVRRIALSLSETVEADGHFSFSVGGKMFVWIYLERVHPKKARVPNPEAIGIYISGEAEKIALLSSDPDIYFTTDHYHGYSAILVHLSRIDFDPLEDLLTDAWYLRAPKMLRKQFDLDWKTEI